MMREGGSIYMELLKRGRRKNEEIVEGQKMEMARNPKLLLTVLHCVLILAVSAVSFVTLLAIMGFPFLDLVSPAGSLTEASGRLPPIACAYIAWAIPSVLTCAIVLIKLGFILPDSALDLVDGVVEGVLSGVTACGLYVASFLIGFYPVRTVTFILMCVPIAVFIVFVLCRHVSGKAPLVAACLVSWGNFLFCAAAVSVVLTLALTLCLKGAVYAEASGSRADITPEDAAMKVVYSEEYKNAAQDERLDMLADFVEAEAGHLGIQVPAVRAVLASSATDAFYNDSSRAIHINANSSVLASTGGNVAPAVLLHEVFHAHQHDVVEGRIDVPANLSQERIDAWEQNMRDYHSPEEDLAEYEGQALEEDADEYAESRIYELIDMKEVFAAMAE